MGLFNRARELVGEPWGHLLKSGVAGSAKITHAKQGAMYSGVAKDPVVTFTLEVTIPGRAH